jgi:hypothetical protein
MKLDHPNPALDDPLDVLADARRRTILRFLWRQTERFVSIEHLVRHLNARDQETTPVQLETELSNRHLPKLHEQGLIDYDVRNGQIQYHSDETTEDLLQLLGDF